MEDHLLQWLHLILRWLHFIFGISWIGASFYFNWLEGALERRYSSDHDLAGDLWAIHGGGFYHVSKYKVAPPRLPQVLHWFKWEAYLTWISGFFLLCLIYYWGASSYLLDSRQMQLTAPVAIAIGIAALVGSWLVYDVLCKSALAARPVAFVSVGFALFAALCWGLCSVFSSRGAYIHVGAVLGTLMAANVFRVIIPNQKKMVAAMMARQVPDPLLGKKGLQRSLHNNYLTLPVLFIMISNHFPMTFGHRYNWIILLLLSLLGAMVRHYFNLRNRRQRKTWVLPIAVLLLLGVVLLSRPQQTAPLSDTAQPPDAAAVTAIFKARCTSCHSAAPTDDVFTIAPNGVEFDTLEQIRSKASVIMERVVHTETMPLANKTEITAEERALIGRWVATLNKP